MKPEELRIGNLAQDQNGNILEVRGIKVGNIHYYVIDRSKYPLNEGWQAEPIPLTEEWLLKFGFLWSEYNQAWVYRKMGVGAELIYHNEGLIEMESARIKCEFTHQLQNLYYALTGEELEIKK